MKNKNTIVIGLVIILTINLLFVIGLSNTNPIESHNNDIHLSSSSLGFQDLLNNIFNYKLGYYSTYGYFPQIYKPSVQATYYALEILESLDRLNEIATTQITNFIMSFYQPNKSIFIDAYAERYMESDPDMEIIYPLSSLLEINCYAVLSLEILGKLELIDKQGMIDFIWDCYHPVDNAFIGRPFEISIPEYQKLPTMDNTFYAIELINLLDNWELYPQVKNDIVDYIIGLQSTGSHPNFFGGFFNDNDFIISSLKFNDPNLLSSYYCLKSLEMFNRIDAINANNFNLYLNRLYNPIDTYFYFSAFTKQHKEVNVIGSALALELAQLTGFSNYSKIDVSQFVRNNRNSWGVWKQSTNIEYHELIDTFQVIRSLGQINELSQLTENEIDLIVAALSNYYNLGGFTHLSEDYSSLELLYSLINAFDDKLQELPISQLFLLLESSCWYDPFEEGDIFLACTNMNFQSIFFRSLPIEYYSYGTANIGMIQSHKTTFLALNSLQKISKLDDFALNHDLSNILERIIGSQFLNQSYSNYGGFLPTYSFNRFSTMEYKNDRIEFENAYYAICALKLLNDYLQLGNFSDIGINVNALESYILNHKIETPSEIYFFPPNIDNAEQIIEHTYYAVYMLTELNRYTLDSSKIKNFIEMNLNYTNLKNVYFSYLISNILDLKIYFQVNFVQNLISDIYDANLHEFYESVEREEVYHKILHWVSYMEKYFQNPDYSDAEFFKDFSAEFTHATILGIILVAAPSGIVYGSSRRISPIENKKRSLFKHNKES
ncbi:MAG: hypothetical protein ACFFDX_09880 [Candidatus Odinarchaeota archaeon]